MAKTERELAFLRDLEISDSWTKRFTDLIDKHIDLKGVDRLLYMNAGTGDHCLAIAEKGDKLAAIVATCENDELLNIARDKSVALRSKTEFLSGDLPDDDFDAVIVDASFTRPEEIADLLGEAVRTTRKGGRVLFAVPAAGSFGEVFSLLWEVFLNVGSGELGPAAEELVYEIPSTSRLEDLAREAGLADVKIETVSEIFEYENGSEFISSPLMNDYLLERWLAAVDDGEHEKAKQELVRLVDEEDGQLTFRFTVKAALVSGKKQ